MTILARVKSTPGRRLPAAAVGVVLALGALAGCSAAAPPSRPAPSSAQPAPSFGPDVVTLAELGFRNGPVDRVPLPAGVRLAERIDQPNVVTIVITAPPGEEFIAFLADRLPEAGFEVRAASASGIVFSGFGWDGGATAGEATALTLRLRDG